MAERALALVLLISLVVACGGGDGDETGDDPSTGVAATEATGATGTGADGTVTQDTPTGDATDDSAATGDPTGGTDATGDATGSTGAAETGSTGEPVGPPGHFLAIGDGGRRVRSEDGALWDGLVGSGLLDTDEETAAPDALRALAVGDGYIVAVGGGGNFYKGNSMVMRSTDNGVTWQEDILKDKPDYSPHKLYGVAASGQVLVAAGMRGKRIRSEDGGLTWTDISFEDQNSRLHAVAAQGSTFVVAGWTEDSYEAPKTSAILTSTDLGVTWGPVDESFARLDALAAGNNTFVAIGVSQCLRSPDGVAWVDCGPLSADYKGISFAGGEFVLSTTEGLATSIDGLQWTTPMLPEAGTPAQLARGNGRWVGVRWTDRGWSEDLENWTYSTWATEPLRALVFIETP
jgi:hypothetical protein